MTGASWACSMLLQFGPRSRVASTTLLPFLQLVTRIFAPQPKRSASAANHFSSAWHVGPCLEQ